MMVKLLDNFFCLLGLLLLSSIIGFAQKNGNGEKTVDFSVIVESPPDKIDGGYALIPLDDVQIHLTLSNGQHLSTVTWNYGNALFKGVPAGCEYVAEISHDGYATAIYHGRIPAKKSFPNEFYMARSSSESEKAPSFFEDPGPADVEGFVVYPSEKWIWVSEPLQDAVVLYTSSSDLLYTTTDQHGYFRFDGVKDKEGKVSISYPNYKTAEVTVPLEDNSRWLWVKMEKDL